MPIFTKDEASVLFVHVPKAGGSSVEKWFTSNKWKMEGWNGSSGAHSSNWYRHCSPQHLHAQPLADTYRISRFDAILMVVRHPLDRFRSEYLMRSKTQNPRDRKKARAWAESALKRYAQDPYVFDNHIRPQHEFVLPGASVYRLEDGLDQMAADVSGRLGMKFPAAIPRVRQSNSKAGFNSQEVVLDDLLRQMLIAFYRDDFTAFGYAPDADDGASRTPLRRRLRPGRR